MLTYETLRQMVAKEKEATKLTDLPENFFDDVKGYLDKKSKMGEGKEDTWELESARRLLQDLLEIRERKILSLALSFVRSGVTPGNLAPEEKEFFDTLVKNIKDFQRKRKDVLEGKQEAKKLVAILNPLPEFVGTNLKTYGPYKTGDIATVPVPNAKLLIEKGIAREIKEG